MGTINYQSVYRRLGQKELGRVNIQVIKIEDDSEGATNVNTVQQEIFMGGKFCRIACHFLDLPTLQKKFKFRAFLDVCGDLDHTSARH